MSSMVVALIRELGRELHLRADRWALDAGGARDPEIGKSHARHAAILRDLAGALEAAAKKTLFA
jgi:hypothetical protein